MKTNFGLLANFVQKDGDSLNSFNFSLSVSNSQSPAPIADTARESRWSPRNLCPTLRIWQSMDRGIYRLPRSDQRRACWIIGRVENKLVGFLKRKSSVPILNSLKYIGPNCVESLEILSPCSMQKSRVARIRCPCYLNMKNVSPNIYYYISSMRKT